MGRGAQGGCASVSVCCTAVVPVTCTKLRGQRGVAAAPWRACALVGAPVRKHSCNKRVRRLNVCASTRSLSAAAALVAGWRLQHASTHAATAMNEWPATLCVTRESPSLTIQRRWCLPGCSVSGGHDITITGNLSAHAHVDARRCKWRVRTPQHTTAVTRIVQRSAPGALLDARCMGCPDSPSCGTHTGTPVFFFTTVQLLYETGTTSFSVMRSYTSRTLSPMIVCARVVRARQKQWQQHRTGQSVMCGGLGSTCSSATRQGPAP
jgi:hypothetical protein